MRGVHRVAHQHHMTLAVEVVPLAAAHTLEVQPGRAAQVARIAQQGVAVQVAGEQLLAERDGLLGARLIQPVRLPHVLRRLDDVGRGPVVELVDVALEPAVFGLLEVEIEGVVELGRTQPDEAVGPCHHVGLEDARVLVADPRVDAVAGDDEVGVGEVGIGVDFGLEQQFHAERFAARLQDVEQLLAADAHKTVPAGADHPALEVQLDVIPVVEGHLDGVRRRPVPVPHAVQGGVREDHAPAEGVVGAVALHHRDVVRRVQLLHQQREIQAGGATADADDAHGRSWQGARRQARR